jgi:DegV family protein with EDD domain
MRIDVKAHQIRANFKLTHHRLRESRALSSSPQTAVVCDTTAYLPDALVEKRGIERISLYVAIDGHQEAESEITDFADFYERLRASEGGATTSQPSIGDFLSVYEPLLDAGREIVSIHISAGISGTFEAAGQARDRLTEEGKGGDRVHIFDSRSAAGGMGLCVLAASGAAAAGGDPQAVLARAEQARQELKMWFAIDTLEYLRRGGRIGGARAWIGSALKIKPILTLEEEITPVERVRTRARSIERLRDYARKRHEDGFDAWVVQHIQDFETADALLEDAREIYGCEPTFVSEIGPVLGAHVGPGLLGIGSVSKSVLE